MDRLPDEWLQKLLNYAMIRETPCCIQEYSKNNWSNKHGQSMMSAAIDEQPQSTQRSHLLDWRLVVGTCRRFRRLGKEAFFSQKVFAMEPSLAIALQGLQFTLLTTEDQKTAVKYMGSVIFIVDNLYSPSSFLTLSSRVSKFPRLGRLDHLFGY